MKQDAEQLVVAMLDGLLPAEGEIKQWVEEYMRLEALANRGQGSKVQDERMNMIYDYLLVVVEKEIAR